jgi:hypothetical protein
VRDKNVQTEAHQTDRQIYHVHFKVKIIANPYHSRRLGEYKNSHRHHRQCTENNFRLLLPSIAWGRHHKLYIIQCLQTIILHHHQIHRDNGQVHHLIQLILIGQKEFQVLIKTYGRLPNIPSFCNIFFCLHVLYIIIYLFLKEEICIYFFHFIALC